MDLKDALNLVISYFNGLCFRSYNDFDLAVRTIKFDKNKLDTNQLKNLNNAVSLHDKVLKEDASNLVKALCNPNIYFNNNYSNQIYASTIFCKNALYRNSFYSPLYDWDYFRLMNDNLERSYYPVQWLYTKYLQDMHIPKYVMDVILKEISDVYNIEFYLNDWRIFPKNNYLQTRREQFIECSRNLFTGDDVNKVVGQYGEELLNDKLLHYYNNVMWVSKEIGDGFGYDFLCIDNKLEDLRLVESKATREQLGIFSLSNKEQSIMRSSILNNTKYRICNFFVYLDRMENLMVYKPRSYDEENNIVVCDVNDTVNKFCYREEIPLSVEYTRCKSKF